MRPFTDDTNESDYTTTTRVRRKYDKRFRKKMRFSSSLSNGPEHKRRSEYDPDNESNDDYPDYAEFPDYEEYGDYDENEFDSYGRLRPY